VNITRITSPESKPDTKAAGHCSGEFQAKALFRTSSAASPHLTMLRSSPIAWLGRETVLPTLTIWNTLAANGRAGMTAGSKPGRHDIHQAFMMHDGPGIDRTSYEFPRPSLLD